MSNSTLPKLNIPDIRESIYQTNNLFSCVTHYLSRLKQYDSIEAQMLLYHMQHDYLEYLIRNNRQKGAISRNFADLHNNIIRNNPDLYVITRSRFKALTSFFNKALITLSDGKDLDTIRDTKACRHIINTTQINDPEQIIQKLCKVTNETIQFLLNNGYQIYIATKPKNIEGFIPEEHPDVYIPHEDYLHQKYRKYIKDYVYNPKWNGYQSFHITAKDERLNVFEIQIRSYLMNIHAEYNLASHNSYKKSQIDTYHLPSLDYSLIEWINYFYRDIVDISGKKIRILDDNSGLEKSLSIWSEFYQPF